jgi:hypothetical protein
VIVTPREPGLFLSMETAYLLERVAGVAQLRQRVYLANQQYDHDRRGQ